jgi:hypothetical protein
MERLEDADQLGKPIDHVLALAELVVVVELGDVDDALEVVRLASLPMILSIFSPEPVLLVELALNDFRRGKLS